MQVDVYTFRKSVILHDLSVCRLYRYLMPNLFELQLQGALPTRELFANDKHLNVTLYDCLTEM